MPIGRDVAIPLVARSPLWIAASHRGISYAASRGTGLIRTKLVDLLSHGALLFVEVSPCGRTCHGVGLHGVVAMTLSWEYLRSERVVSQIAGFNE
jgi:hypothetical protein